MLALRLSWGARPAAQLRRVALVAASAGTGFLLLSALGWALGHPASPSEALLRLAWCGVPLAATVHLAVTVARTDPGARSRPALTAAGFGPAGLAVLAAAGAGLACLLGSLFALTAFLLLRGDVPGPFGGDAAELLAAERSLPRAAVALLLVLVPATAALACRLVLGGARVALWRTAFRTRNSAAGTADGAQAAARTSAERMRDSAVPAQSGQPALHGRGRDALREKDAAEYDEPTAPAGLPWGVALLATGLAVQMHAGRLAQDTGAALWSPGGPAGGVLAGWLLAAAGLVLAGPGLTHLCGRLLTAVRPGPLRLVAGRGLQEEASRTGRPLGLLLAVAAATVTAVLAAGDGARSPGPLGALGAALVAGCAVTVLLSALRESHQDRAGARSALRGAGASRGLLRSTVVLRLAAVTAVFVPLTLLVAFLAATPLTR